jgi:hypothetical protein
LGILILNNFLDSIHEDITETDTVSEFDTEITEEDMYNIIKLKEEEDLKLEEEENKKVEDEEKNQLKKIDDIKEENEELKKSNIKEDIDELRKEEYKKKKRISNPQVGLKTLKTLDISGCNRITGKGFSYLQYICQHVVSLNLKGCTKLKDDALSNFLKFKNLEYLNLTGW